MADVEGRGYDGQASTGDRAGSLYDRLQERLLQGQAARRERDRGRDQGRRGAHPSDWARLRVATDRRTRRDGGGECGGPRGTGGAACGRGGDRRRRPSRSGSDASVGGAGERGDRGGASGAGGVQYLADRYGGGDWAGLRASASVTRPREYPPDRKIGREQIP